MDKEIIIRNFSRYAHTYDRYADIQKRVASQLIALINQNGLRKILEIGCGTGNYTLLLRDKFRSAKLQAIDISEKMVEVASRKLQKHEVEFNVADAENINFRKKFDLITSNACFQWFEDLKGTLGNYVNYLNINGCILFSIFGPRTFKELNESLISLGMGASGNGVNFISQDKLRLLLENNFREAEIKEFTYEEDFACLKDLLRKIKYTGIRGEGLSNKALLTPKVISRLENKYLNKFKKIKATYQVFYCKGKR